MDSQDTLEKFVKLIKELVADRTQTSLARELNLSDSVISRWLSRDVKPEKLPIETLLRLVEIKKYTPDRFLGEIGLFDREKQQKQIDEIIKDFEGLSLQEQIEFAFKVNKRVATYIENINNILKEEGQIQKRLSPPKIEKTVLIVDGDYESRKTNCQAFEVLVGFPKNKIFTARNLKEFEFVLENQIIDYVFIDIKMNDQKDLGYKILQRLVKNNYLNGSFDQIIVIHGQPFSQREIDVYKALCSQIAAFLIKPVHYPGLRRYFV